MRGGGPELWVVLVGCRGGVKLGLVVVPGLVVVVLVLGVEVPLTSLGRGSDGQLVGTGAGTGPRHFTPGVTTVRSDGLSHVPRALLSLRHGGQLGRLVVGPGGVEVGAPGHVRDGRDVGHGGQHGERMVGGSTTGRDLVEISQLVVVRSLTSGRENLFYLGSIEIVCRNSFNFSRLKIGSFLLPVD